MLRKIAITGPESSGKSTLCSQLSAHFQCMLVPEMARIILEKEGPVYDAVKVEEMARIQLEEEFRLEKIAENQNQPFLFCDTNLLVYRVWMEVRFGYCPSWIEEEIHKSRYDLQFLLKPDLPWQADPLRENPLDRHILFQHYEKYLQSQESPWFIITGQNRFPLALRTIKEMLP